MRWTQLEQIDQLETIDALSMEGPVVIFKHSTRCLISTMVLARFQRGTGKFTLEHVSYYLLDLLQFRSISDAIAEHYNEEHASPQVLVIRNGACVYSTSHMGITADEVAEELELYMPQ